MKLTKAELKQIIKEQLIKEGPFSDGAKAYADDRARRAAERGEGDTGKKGAKGDAGTGMHAFWDHGTGQRFPNIADYLKATYEAKDTKESEMAAQKYLLGDMRIYTERFVQELMDILGLAKGKK